MKIKKELIFAIAGSAVSLACGYLLGAKSKERKINSCGNLRIDNSEEGEPVKMFFEVTNQNVLMSSEYVVLKVIKEPYISHNF